MKQFLLAMLITFIGVSLAAAQTANKNDLPNDRDKQETRYTVLISGRTAGAQTSVIKPDGTREFAYEFSDRGRGSKLSTRIRLDADGLPVFLETVGNNSLKAPVAETFMMNVGAARWKNNSEAGEKKLAAKAFYVSLDSAPEELALLAQALLKSPTKRLSLLPAGEANIERSGELALENNGKTARVTAYEIYGLNFSPNIVWLDEDNRYFASSGGWTTVIHEGWEANAPQLLKAESELELKHFAKLARELTRKPAKPIVFTNADLFDAESGKILPNTTVVVEGNRIAAVGKNGAVKIPKNSEKIDARQNLAARFMGYARACQRRLSKRRTA